MSKSKGPPRPARFLLERLIDNDIRFGALGDLEEQYVYLKRKKGVWFAALHYWLQVAAAIPSFFRNSITWSCIMTKNYLKSFFRSLKKHKGYSFLNFSGLAIGLCVFILIMLFVQHEMGYDKFNEKIDRIYRVQGANGRQAWMAPGVGKWIKERIPEVEKMVRFKFRHDYLAEFQPEGGGRKKSLVIRDFGWADPEVFDIFTLPLITGNPDTALNGPFSLILTESLARRIFGQEYPIGKTIKINNRHEYQVTGVMKDPKQFHLTFEALASFQNLGKIIGQSELDSFNSWNLSTFVLLPEEHDTQIINIKVTELFREKLNELRKSELEFEMFPLKGLYFKNTGFGKRGNLQVVIVYIVVAVFILLIACVNFINLSTARASIRAKEVGIKKVVGSSRKSLMIQFLSEAVLFCVFALGAAVSAAAFLVPNCRQLFQRELSLAQFLNPGIVIIFISGAVLVGILAGFYPAFYLSAFRPAAVLNGKQIKGAKSGYLRKILISAQFAISIFLIISTVTIIKQINYFKHSDLGFQKEHILYFEFARNRSLKNSKQAVRERLLQHPQIQNVTYSQGRPGLVYNWEGLEYQGERSGYAVFTVEPEFFGTYGLEIIEGRNFDPQRKSDRLRTCLLNETAVRQYGIKDPVGMVLHHEDLGGSSFPSKDVEIIGVVKDFHYQSFHYQIQPMIFGWNPGWHWMASVRLTGEDIPGTVAFIQKIWQEISPEFPFEYHFVDTLFDQQYQNEERLGRLIGYFAGLGVIIACLGLFGLASFMAEQRTKEIGIRKILGARIPNLVLLMAKEFSGWVLLANLIAWPLAYWAAYTWLGNFAYRTSLGIWPFLISAAAALGIALLTVSYQSLRAATSNPIDSLRYE